MALHFLSVSILGALVLALSLLNQTWVDYPTGFDAEGHMSKIEFIALFWPKTSWAHIWYDGMPLFRWYGPIPEHLAALLVRTGFFSTELSVTFISLVSIAVIVMMTYFTAFSITRSRSAAWFCALLTWASSFLWGLAFIGGFFARITTIGFVSAALYYSFKFARETLDGNHRRSTLFWLVTFLSLALASHPAIGAVGLLTPLYLCILLPVRKSARVSSLVRVFVPTGLLSLWFMFPALYNAPAGVTGQGFFSVSMLSLSSLFSFSQEFAYTLTGLPIGSHRVLGSLSPVIIPLFLVLVAVTWRVKPRSSRTALSSVAVKSLLLSSGTVIVYAFLTPELVFAVPTLFLLFLSLPLISAILFRNALNVSTLDDAARPKPRIRIARVATIGLLLCLIILSLFVQYPSMSEQMLPPEVRPKTSYFAEDVVGQLVMNETAAPDYRFGIPDDALAWLNRRYPALPQTRGYYAPGIVNRDWMQWFEVAAWQNASASELNFVFDWSAIKWFVVYPPVDPSRFTSMPDSFDTITSRPPVYGFVYKHASPIISVGNTPTLLVIGKNPQANMLILQDLSFTEYDSRHVITIIGDEYVDDYSAAELQQFDAIMLYGYRYHDKVAAYDLLKGYVSNGGGLLIETGYLVEGTEPNLPDPSPVKNVLSLAPPRDWKFSFESGPIIENIALSSFSPAKYDQGPWFASASSNDAIRPWAKAVLWTDGHPIVATGEFGKGRVVWSGINLPFHISSYKNAYESQFLAKMVSWISRASEELGTSVEYSVERQSPENVIIEVTRPGSEILFKEFYTEDWHATLSDARKSSSELTILKAGPGFMCVRLPSVVEYPIEVHFDYHTNIIENVTKVVSIITLAGLVMYAGTPLLFDRIHDALRRRMRSISDRISTWGAEQ